jgi:hypothetical protein
MTVPVNCPGLPQERTAAFMAHANESAHLPPTRFVNNGFSYLYSVLLPVGELVRNGDVCFVGDLTADTQAPGPKTI